MSESPDEVAVPVLYLDIDGTVREGKDDALGRFVNGPEDVRVFPEAVKAMRRWKEGGGRVVGVTNQGGVALRKVRADDVKRALAETHGQADRLFDSIHICFHHPDASHPEWARCWCRKPSAGAVAEAAHALKDANPDEYYPPYMALFIGDRDEDRQCAESAGIDFQWAHEWRREAGA